MVCAKLFQNHVWSITGWSKWVIMLMLFRTLATRALGSIKWKEPFVWDSFSWETTPHVSLHWCVSFLAGALPWCEREHNGAGDLPCLIYSLHSEGKWIMIHCNLEFGYYLNRPTQKLAFPFSHYQVSTRSSVVNEAQCFLEGTWWEVPVSMHSIMGRELLLDYLQDTERGLCQWGKRSS